MFEHFHCFFFSAYSDDILFVERVLCLAIDIPTLPTDERAGVGQSSQDAESQTYLPVAANSPYVPPPSLVCLHSSSRLLDLDAHFPFYLLDLDALFPLLPSPGCSPSFGGMFSLLIPSLLT